MTGDPEASVERKKAERPSAPPREANDVRATVVITAGWAVALVVLLVLLAMPGTLPDRQRWWLWTCVTGVAMGLFGIWYVPVLQRRRARAAARHAEGLGQPSDSGYESLDNGSKTVSSTDTPGSSTRS